MAGCPTPTSSQAEPGGDAFLVDAGGPLGPLFEKADEHGLTVTHILLTHHHHDHVAELGAALERWPGAVVLSHPEERVPGTTGDLRDGDVVQIGGVTVRALHTPGHTAGMLALVADGNVFTGDTLFKGSVGGVRAPGSTGYEDLKRSIMEVLLELPPETVVRPGPHRPDHGRRRARVQPLRADLARARPGGLRIVHRAGRAGHAGAPRRRLRRRPQGLGALVRRARRHRAGL